MKGLAAAVLAFGVTRTIAQEVVTVSVNTGTCAPAGNGGPGGSGGSAVGSGTAATGTGTEAPLSGVITSDGLVVETGVPDTGAPVTSPYGTYKFDGIYAIPPGGTVLNGPVTESPEMTVEYCATFCQGTPFYALYGGDKCNCGSAAPSEAPVATRRKSKRQAPPTIPCAGDPSEACGGFPDFANLFQVAAVAATSAPIVVTSAEVVSSTDAAGSVTLATVSSLVVESPPPSITPVSVTPSAVAIVESPPPSTTPVSETPFVVTPSSTPSSIPPASVTPSSIPPASVTPIVVTSAVGISITNAAGSETIVSVSTPVTFTPPVSVTPASITPASITSVSIAAPSSITPPASITPISVPSAVSQASQASQESQESQESQISQGGLPSLYSVYSVESQESQYSQESQESQLSQESVYPTLAPSTTAAGVMPSGTGVVASGASGFVPSGSGVAPSGSSTNVPAITRHTVGPDNTPDPVCMGTVAYAASPPVETDALGVPYNIECSSGIAGTLSDRYAHADNFNDCLAVCSLFDDCAGVTYTVPTDQDNLNCGVFTSATGFAYPQSGTIAAMPVNGEQTSAIGDNNLCTENPSYNGKPYTDIFGNTYNIGCDQNTDGGSGNTNLGSTIFDSLEECLTYCSVYDGCVGVVWIGPYTQGTGGSTYTGNCYPFSAAGTAQAYAGNQYALLA